MCPHPDGPGSGVPPSQLDLADARRRRREVARQRTRQQRRLAAVSVLLALLAGGTVVGARVADSDDSAVEVGREPLELPRGGRQILPRFRVVAFYGAPQAEELGALGV